MFAVQMLVLKLGTWGNSIWNLEEVWTRDINDKGCADALKAGKSSKKETIVIEFIGMDNQLIPVSFDQNEMNFPKV